MNRRKDREKRQAIRECAGRFEFRNSSVIILRAENFKHAT
jgi:hypothetical protein